MAIKILTDNKTGQTREYNESEKTYYYALDVNASTALVNVKAYQAGDGSYGNAGSKTNFDGSGGKLPHGYKMNIFKIGFIYRLSTGAALTPAVLSKLVLGTYSIRIGRHEVKQGSMAEFFQSALTVESGTSAPMQASAFIPLLGADGEWWEDENLEFTVSAPVMEANGEILCCLKGLLYVPIS